MKPGCRAYTIFWDKKMIWLAVIFISQTVVDIVCDQNVDTAFSCINQLGCISQICLQQINSKWPHIRKTREGVKIGIVVKYGDRSLLTSCYSIRVIVSWQQRIVRTINIQSTTLVGSNFIEISLHKIILPAGFRWTHSTRATCHRCLSLIAQISESLCTLCGS